MPQVLIEGYTADEILALSKAEVNAIVLKDEPIVFKVGSANLLGKFKVEGEVLVLELAMSMAAAKARSPR